MEVGSVVGRFTVSVGGSDDEKVLGFGDGFCFGGSHVGDGDFVAFCGEGLCCFLGKAFGISSLGTPQDGDGGTGGWCRCEVGCGGRRCRAETLLASRQIAVEPTDLFGCEGSIWWKRDHGDI